MLDQYGHEASGMQKEGDISYAVLPLSTFSISCPLLSFSITCVYFIRTDLVLPMCVRLSAGARMVVASACHASGLMGKNDRNLQLIMPGLEMFVSR